MDKSRKPQLVIFIFAFIAFAISLYILVAVKSHQVLYGCGNDGCHQVLAGRWEHWGPVPVAVLGIGGYLALMAGTIFTSIPQFRKGYVMVWYLMAIESIVGLGFIAWLIFLQGAVIKHFCIFCLSSHLFGFIAYTISVLRVPVWNRRPHSRMFVGCSATAILLFMIGFHIGIVPDIHAAELAENIDLASSDNDNNGGILFGKNTQQSRTVHLLNSQLTFDIYKMPVIGSRSAQYVALELSDYCCPSCRKLHARMHQFREQYDVEICIVYLPTPMNTSCNSNIKKTPQGFKNACTLAEFGMAVNIAKQDKFEEFHNFMMEGSHPPSVEEARKKAEELVGKDNFEKALKDPQVKDWIANGVNVQRYIKAKTIPRLITQKHVVSYSGGSKAGFARLMKKVLAIEDLNKRK